MPIAPILVGLLLVIGTIALALSGTRWRWYHITIASLIMLLSTVWFYLAARTLKIEQAWRTEIVGWEKAEINAAKEHERVVKGGYTDTADGKEHPLALDQLQTENTKRLQGRGRVWPQAARKSVTPDGKIVATVPEPTGIEKNMVLYVFDDTKLNEDGQFLGAFEVTDVKGKDVSLVPVLKLRSEELQRIAQRRDAKLVMYETVPADAHEFMQLTRDVIKEMVPAANKEEVEKADEAKLLSYVNSFRNVPDAVKQEYAKDNKKQDSDPQPERLWPQVKVLKDIFIPLSADEIKQAQAASQTLEVDSANNQPAKKIPEGTTLLLDPKTAAEKIAAGQVEAVKGEDGKPVVIYVRPLRDYARLYRALNLQIEEILRASAEVDRQTAAVQAAQKKVDQDIAYRTDENARLLRDKAHYEAENKLINAHVAALEKELARVDGEVQHYLTDNRQKETELVKVAHETARIIDLRTPPVSAPAQ